MHPTWPTLLTYPQHVSASTRSTLDALESLLPVTYPLADRALRMSTWLDDAVTLGLVSSAERSVLRSDIASNL